MVLSVTSPFPFLFGGTFIEADIGGKYPEFGISNFPSFSEGLSLRRVKALAGTGKTYNFPSFSEGLSLRR